MRDNAKHLIEAQEVSRIDDPGDLGMLGSSLHVSIDGIPDPE